MNKVVKIIIGILVVIGVGFCSKSVYDDNQEKKAKEQEKQKLVERYGDNSLSNGSQPYAEWYGYNRSSYYEAEISVKTSGENDVVVIVKRNDENGDVIGHAYVRAGLSYDIPIPSGQCQVFFYSGKGWNPEKNMPNGVRGGFLEGSVSNDKPFYISEGEQMTYTLTPVRHGNFRPQHSSIDAAF